MYFLIFLFLFSSATALPIIQDYKEICNTTIEAGFYSITCKSIKKSSIPVWILPDGIIFEDKLQTLFFSGSMAIDRDNYKSIELNFYAFMELNGTEIICTDEDKVFKKCVLNIDSETYLGCKENNKYTYINN